MAIMLFVKNRNKPLIYFEASLSVLDSIVESKHTAHYFILKQHIKRDPVSVPTQILRLKLLGIIEKVTSVNRIGKKKKANQE